MSIKSGIGDLLTFVRTRLYRGNIQRLVNKIGLNRHISEPYKRLEYRLAGNSIEQVIRNNQVKFLVNTFAEFTRFQQLAGEKEILSDFISELDRGDIVYDIGSNVGTYTCFAASELGDASVVAFEPEPQNAIHLRKNLDLNDLSAKVIEVALSDTNGEVKLSLSGNEAGEGGHAITTDDTKDGIWIETVRGDTIIERENLTPPTILKIDVEGAEMKVLRGLEETLRKRCRLVYVEVHPNKIDEFGSTESEISNYLEKTGFEVTKVAERGEEFFLRAAK